MPGGPLLSPRTVLFSLATVLGIALDQGTKWWVVQSLEVGRDEIPLIPGFLSFVHAQNHGAAFSTFNGMTSLFLVFTVVAVAVIIDLARKLPAQSKLMPIALGLILSGALGNGVDRVRQAYVTDFIKVYTDQAELSSWLVSHFGTNVWPIFNVADMALLIGVGAFALHYLLEGDAEVELTDEPDLTAPVGGKGL